MCQIWKVNVGWRIELLGDADFWWPGLIPGTLGNEYVTGLLNTKLHLIHPRLLTMLQAVSESILSKVRCPSKASLSGPRTYSVVVRKGMCCKGQLKDIHSISKALLVVGLDTGWFFLRDSIKVLSLGVLFLFPSLLPLHFSVPIFFLPFLVPFFLFFIHSEKSLSLIHSLWGANIYQV